MNLRSIQSTFIVRFSLVTSLCFTLASVAEEKIIAQQTLPEPLTLEHALSLAGESSQPSILKSQALSDQLKSQKQLQQSNHDLTVHIDAYALKTQPSTLMAYNKDNRDTPHSLQLTAKKVLYDFGQSSLEEDIIENKHQASLTKVLYQQEQNYLTILNDYLNVLIADLKVAHTNEALAMTYIRFDRSRTAFEQKKVSELELMRLENINLKMSDKLFENETQQRLTRAKLAHSLNRSGQLSADLEMPDFEKFKEFSSKRMIKSDEELIQLALNNNLQIKQIKQQITAAQKQHKLSGKGEATTLSVELGGAWYARDYSSGDQWKVGLHLKVPLYEGGRRSAKKSQAYTQLQQYEAELELKKDLVEQEVLQVAMSIKLLKRRAKQLDKSLEYQELYLDKSRIEYDHEFKSDLGNAMVNLSLAQLERHQNNFKLAYQWALLDVLTSTNLTP